MSRDVEIYKKHASLLTVLFILPFVVLWGYGRQSKENGKLYKEIVIKLKSNDVSNEQRLKLIDQLAVLPAKGIRRESFKNYYLKDQENFKKMPMSVTKLGFGFWF